MRLRHLAPVVFLVGALVATGCKSPKPTVPVMGPTELSAAQLALWFIANQPDDGKGPCLKDGFTIEKLAAVFVDEAGDEFIRGDIAFAQSIIETGWFRYGGLVKCRDNNYAGIGAVDGGTRGNRFPRPRIGVRAQIQHLRAYADRTVTVATLHHRPVDPRFSLINPKGFAPNWNQFGNGVWATDRRYARKVIRLYDDMRVFVGLPPVWPPRAQT
jgi:mannosyl-glycoprotein endo-beta-N-acetylglucosaminidase